MSGKYRVFRESNLLGLESSPSEWDIKKIKYLFYIGRGRVISQEELEDNGSYPVYSSQTNNSGCLGYINSYDFNCDQLTWTTDGANAGTIFIREGKHNCTNVCGTLQLSTKYASLKFMAYSLQYMCQFHKRPDTNGAKIMNNEMAEISIPLPSKQEQTQIAAFLDHETTKIDSLIEKQQRLIELLKEKRQAVISHAVTKGLDPDVPMKDSGVEWLGEIPKHWNISKLRYMFSFGKGLTITKENLIDDGIPCVNYGEVHSKYAFEIAPTKHPLKCVDLKYIQTSESSLLYKGDIIFADTSEDIEGSGNFTQLVSDETLFAGYHTIIARPHNRMYSRFYAYQLDSPEVRTQIRHAVKGVKVFSVTQAILRSINIWLPSSKEQAQIAAFLDHETAKIDSLIELQQQQIALLKERRTALISAAVTGKIDVREWHASEVVAQAEPLEATA